MTGDKIRIVVGEGQTLRKGLLRFVLEGDGYEVVGEADTSAELARVLADHQPDVVVLDDGIGATAPQVVREISPKAKIVLVWPGAVVPIGGDARVEPAQVLRELGPAVAKVTGTVPGVFTTIERPEWVEKVRKDPATLRELLEKRGGLPAKRPSVTELQRRGQRLHPARTPAEPAEPETSPETSPERTKAPVVPIPISRTEPTIELPEAGAPVLHLPSEEERRASGAAAAGAAAADREASEVNRRLGAIALGGAAVIGAIVLSLTFGGSRLPTDIIMAEGPHSTTAPGAPIYSGIDEPETNGGNRGPDGDQSPTPPTDLTPTFSPPSPGEPTTPTGPTDPTEPSEPGEPGPRTPPGSDEPPPSIPDGGSNEPSPALPGQSARHNPLGGPPGQTGDHPVASGDTGNGQGGSPAHGSEHPQGGAPGQTGEHPQGGPPDQANDHAGGGAAHGQGNGHANA